MSVNENASLVLNTATGTPNAKYTSCTWSNIDLRQLLGNIYDKYARFNLCLNTIAQGVSASNFWTSSKDGQCIIRINGLPFVNNTYNISSSGNSITSNAIIATFNFTNNSSSTHYFYGSNIATFSKNSDICSITIDYIRVEDLLTPNTSVGSVFPQMTFIFDIFGIDDYKTNDVSRRIKI